MKKILWTALALMVISACEKDPTLNDKFWEEAPLEMEQHQFQIETEILAGLYWHWNNAYASFVEDWTPYNGEKKEPELVFSNRRWFPADYGPRFWSDFDLDNKMVPGTPAVSYYDCDSHPYEKTDLGDGSYRIDVGFLGYEWSGILRPGEDCILRAGDYDEFRLRLLPADAVYDHSLDDLLLVAREFGKQRKK